jgi:mono/diheme cytochrome c family protein
MRVGIALRGLVTVILAALVSAAAAQTEPELTAQEKRGELTLARLCANCHAIGRVGTSPLPEAPQFRTLGRRYKIEMLEEALAEGFVSGHPEMPEFRFSGREVGEIVAYLNAIQQR